MMRATLAALVFAGLVQGAPMPTLPQAAAECAFDCGTPQRAAALWQYVQTPDFAKRAGLAGAKIRVDNLGTTIRFGVSSLREGAALEAAKRAADAVVGEPSKEEMAQLLQMIENSRRMYDDDGGFRGRRLGGLRRKFIARDFADVAPIPPIYEIRLNRPTLKAPPRLVAR